VTRRGDDVNAQRQLPPSSPQPQGLTLYLAHSVRSLTWSPLVLSTLTATGARRRVSRQTCAPGELLPETPHPQQPRRRKAPRGQLQLLQGESLQAPRGRALQHGQALVEGPRSGGYTRGCTRGRLVQGRGSGGRWGCACRCLVHGAEGGRCCGAAGEECAPGLPLPGWPRPLLCPCW